MESPLHHGPCTLDDLLALNDEITALARAGIPLESGLLELGQELPGGSGQLASKLAQRLAQGEGLDRALSASDLGLPKLYVAVATAGLKSGRLSAALEGMASAARRIAELRHVTATAMIYPVVVFLLAWGLFVGFVTFFAPQVLPTFYDFHVGSASVIGWFARLAPSAVWWGPIGPAIALLAVGLWWWQSRKALSLGASRWLAWVPGARGLLRLCQAATFADVLALLIDQRVPLDESLRLAAAATGNRAMAGDAEALAVAVARGAGPSEYLSLAGHFPPLIAWFLSAGQEHRLLVAALRHAAASYQERARHRAEAVQTFLPMLLTLFLGGTTVLAYALLLFAPWVDLLKTVGTP